MQVDLKIVEMMASTNRCLKLNLSKHQQISKSSALHSQNRVDASQMYLMCKVVRMVEPRML